MGPPEFMLKAQRDLHDRLTGLFAPYADELAVDPATAALALRSLTFGAARPEWGMAPALTADEIADLVLHGVRTRTATSGELMLIKLARTYLAPYQQLLATSCCCSSSARSARCTCPS